MPLFSIIIPSFNRASIISKTLDSVLAQTFKDWECLVVDDKSTDNTKEIIEKYLVKDKRIHYLTNELEKGAQGARNTGILYAKGYYVSFLDSDDRWSPCMLQKQKEQYASSERVGCVYSDVHFISTEGVESSFGIPLGIHGHIYPQVLEQGYLAPTSVLSAKRELLVNVGMFDLQLPASQDDDICFKLAKISEVAYIPEVMAYMFANSDNRISDNSIKVAMGWWMLWIKYENDVLQYCGKATMKKHYKECLHNFIHLNNVKMSRKAFKKYSQFGGVLPIKHKMWLMAYYLSNGYINYINRKTKNAL